MAWIRVEQSLRDHAKTLNLMALLNLPCATVVGHLTLLWLWLLDNTRDGNVSHLDKKMLAHAAQYSGDPKLFTDALIKCGFIDNRGDGVYLVHGWDEYGGKLIKSREASIIRAQKSRESKKPMSNDPAPTPTPTPSFKPGGFPVI